MNYQHAYHVGSISDVFKHSVLIHLLQSFHKKPSPFCYFETHAGKALYNLRDAASQKTQEYKDGAFKLWQQKENLHPILNDYLNIISRFNLSNKPLQFYPGSGLIARQYLREKDQAILCEMHPPIHYDLASYFKQDKKVHVHDRNGYEALIASVPPKENRGLVLIDPPYEIENEYEVLVDTLKKAKTRWQNGMYAIWFPIKEYKKVRDFYDALSALGFSEMLVAELWESQDLIANHRLRGSGMVILNAPWQSDVFLKSLLPELAKALDIEKQGRIFVTLQ